MAKNPILMRATPAYHTVAYFLGCACWHWGRVLFYHLVDEKTWDLEAMMDEKKRAFEVFCVYYLGLTPGGESGFFNAQRTAQQWGWDVTQLMAFLQKQRLHPDQVLHTAYPLVSKRLDIEEASLAGQHQHAQRLALQCYTDLRSTRKKRDWLKEIEDEKKEGNF